MNKPKQTKTQTKITKNETKTNTPKKKHNIPQTTTATTKNPQNPIKTKTPTKQQHKKKIYLIYLGNCSNFPLPNIITKPPFY